MIRSTCVHYEKNQFPKITTFVSKNFIKKISKSAIEVVFLGGLRCCPNLMTISKQSLWWILRCVTLINQVRIWLQYQRICTNFHSAIFDKTWHICSYPTALRQKIMSSTIVSTKLHVQLEIWKEIWSWNQDVWKSKTDCLMKKTKMTRFWLRN